MPSPFRIHLFLYPVPKEPWSKGKALNARPQIRAIPEIAYVGRGTEVHWQIHYMLPDEFNYSILRWEIDFGNGSPFRRKDKLLAKETIQGSGETPHSGILEAGPAEEEGEFKYAIRVTDLEGGKHISDEDPFLIIR
jgi:hypothetical protein